MGWKIGVRRLTYQIRHNRKQPTKGWGQGCGKHKVSSLDRVWLTNSPGKSTVMRRGLPRPPSTCQFAKQESRSPSSSPPCTLQMKGHDPALSDARNTFSADPPHLSYSSNASGLTYLRVALMLFLSITENPVPVRYHSIALRSHFQLRLGLQMLVRHRQFHASQPQGQKILVTQAVASHLRLESSQHVGNWPQQSCARPCLHEYAPNLSIFRKELHQSYHSFLEKFGCIPQGYVSTSAFKTLSLEIKLQKTLYFVGA